MPAYSPLKNRTKKRSPAIKKMAPTANGAVSKREPQSPLAHLSPEEKKTLYFGVSANDEGRKSYLRMRQHKSPQQRFGESKCTQHDYGWFMNDGKTKLAPPQHRHVSKTQREFYSNEHGIPMEWSTTADKPPTPVQQEYRYERPQYGRKKRIQMTFYEHRKDKREYGKDFIFPSDPELVGANRFDQFIRRSDLPEDFKYTRPTENVRVKATDGFFSSEPWKLGA